MSTNGRRIEHLLDRIAAGVEKMASDPEIEIEAGPPICPNCGKFDPEVIIPAEEGGRGPLSQAGIACTCTECGTKMYVAIESYSVHKNRDLYLAEVKSRSEGWQNVRTDV